MGWSRIWGRTGGQGLLNVRDGLGKGTGVVVGSGVVVGEGVVVGPGLEVGCDVLAEDVLAGGVLVEVVACAHKSSAAS